MLPTRWEDGHFVVSAPVQTWEQHQAFDTAQACEEARGEMIHTLTLNYNKVRQASITREILEVVSGADATKEK